MNVADFIAKWRFHELNERAAAQEHFIDLCRLVGHPTPVEADPEGRWFTFERGAAKATGGDGWADVWKTNFFGWEYKRRYLFSAAASGKATGGLQQDLIVMHTESRVNRTRAQ